MAAMRRAVFAATLTLAACGQTGPGTETGAGAAWSLAQPVAVGSAPSLAVNPQGQAVLAYLHSNTAGQNDVVVQRYNNGWQSPETVDTSDADARTPSAAIDEHGDVIVGWAQSISVTLGGVPKTAGRAWFRLTANRAWQEPRPLFVEVDPAYLDYPTSSSQPHVALHNGIATATFAEDLPGVTALYIPTCFARYAPGVGWSVTQPSGYYNGANGGYDFSLVMAPTGASLVVYQGDGGADNSGFGEYRGPNVLSTGIIGESTSISPWNGAGPMASTHITGAIDPDGNALALVVAVSRQFLQTDELIPVIYAYYHSATGSWETPVEIEHNPATTSSAHPTVGFDGSGRALAVWEEITGSEHSLKFARFDPVSGWTAEQSLDTQGDARVPHIAVNAAGQAGVVWQRANGAINDLWGASYDPARGWSAPQPLENAPADVTDIGVAIDDAGRITVAWDQAGVVWVSGYR